jgi:RNA polymerase sigma factor (sigma-70 family)
MTADQRQEKSTDSKPSLNTLLHQVAEGSEAALSALVTLTKPTVMQIIRKDVYDPVEADDLSSEVYRKIFEKACQYRSNSNESAWKWIRTISEHVVIDYLRRLKTLRKYEAQESDLRFLSTNKDKPDAEVTLWEMIASEEVLPEDAVVSRQTDAELSANFTKLYACLTKQERQVFNLLMAGRTRKEIAAEMNISRVRVWQIIQLILAKGRRLF